MEDQREGGVEPDQPTDGPHDQVDADRPADEREDRVDADRPAEDAEPRPGVTAPLDDLTEEEARSGPMGVMPGAGPDPDEARHSGVEEREAREAENEG